MKINLSYPYDQDVDTVFRLLSNPDFIKDRCVAMGARNIEVLDYFAGEDLCRIRFKREVPADAPALLKRFFNPWNTLLQNEEWQGKAGGPYQGKFTIEISGVPLHINGQSELSAQGEGGCVNHMQVEFTCDIPLVGGALADFVGGGAEKAIHAEYEFIRGRLAQG